MWYKPWKQLTWGRLKLFCYKKLQKSVLASLPLNLWRQRERGKMVTRTWTSIILQNFKYSQVYFNILHYKTWQIWVKFRPGSTQCLASNVLTEIQHMGDASSLDFSVAEAQLLILWPERDKNNHFWLQTFRMLFL